MELVRGELAPILKAVVKMARALWSGSISFGLVNIPVRLYAATDSHQLEFHQFDARTGRRVRHKRVVEGTDDEVPYEHIVDGYEVRKGRVVTLTDEEMAAAEPRKTRTVEVEQFVALDAIDPVVWSHAYYVGPEANAGARKAYAVLREAMKQTGRVGIARFVMRSKEYLATIRPLGRALVLETMFFADEIRDPAEVPELGASQPAVSAREVEMAKKLIEALSAAWHHGAYKDTHRDQLLQIIKRKAQGETIDVGPSTASGGQVIDLMEALKKSLSTTRAPAATKSGDKKPRTRRRAITKRPKRGGAGASVRRAA